MAIKELRLWNLRLWRQATLGLDQHTVVVGPNASGKSTIAEALALVATLRSPRTSTLSELVSFGETQGGAAVESTTTLEVRISEGRTKLSLAGQPTISRNFLGRFTCVVFGPEDLDLVLGDPSHRRRNLDDTATQLYPAHRAIRLEFDKALRQRNAALKHGEVVQARAYDEVLATAAAELVGRRRQLVEGLVPHCVEAFASLAGKGALGIEYKSQATDVVSAELREFFLQRFDQEEGLDLARGTTRTGPHRDDLELAIDGNAAKAFASRGEQRTAALAIRLAEVQVLGATTLVLDDVASELDMDRRGRVVKTLRDTQTIICTTDLDDVADLVSSARVYNVSDGKLSVA